MATATVDTKWINTGLLFVILAIVVLYVTGYIGHDHPDPSGPVVPDPVLASKGKQMIVSIDEASAKSAEAAGDACLTAKTFADVQKANRDSLSGLLMNSSETILGASIKNLDPIASGNREAARAGWYAIARGMRGGSK